ncbi:f-box domain protein [Rutstroemia sp. NJR-2017a BVV2]|nr:f-box domain protein [Rutstroemia sp. NJR-2017a BVV2]
MAALKITDLPPELLHEIISHSLPESFASLASTCKRIYLLCTPFIEHHKHRRYLFKKAKYKRIWTNEIAGQIETAFQLITRIAFEPIVARYIIDADLSMDSYPPRAEPSVAVPDIHDGGPVVALFASSPYLRDAGLDWKEYYCLMKEERGDVSSHYSQHAATFLLTLLPNVRTLTLPISWKPVESTNRILDVIVRKARLSNHLWSTSSLNQVTIFEPLRLTTGIRSRSDLDQAMPFLALPRMRSFRGFSIVAVSNTPLSFASINPYLHYGTFLETVSFPSSCIDEVAIAEFLRHTPHLKKFRYSHDTRDELTKWNICEFVTAIEREVGSHLEELSVSISKPDGAVTPGKACMRGFKCLRKLEFPLEIAICNLNDAARQLNTANEDLSYEGLEGYDLIDTLVPASVIVLSLLSRGRDCHDKALQAMFRGFSAKKSSRYPVLAELRISRPARPRAHASYEEECKKLAGEMEKIGVVLHRGKCNNTRRGVFGKHKGLRLDNSDPPCSSNLCHDMISPPRQLRARSLRNMELRRKFPHILIPLLRAPQPSHYTTASAKKDRAAPGPSPQFTLQRPSSVKRVIFIPVEAWQTNSSWLTLRSTFFSFMKGQGTKQEKGESGSYLWDEDEWSQLELTILVSVVTVEGVNGSPRQASRRKSLLNLEPSPEPNHNEAGSRSDRDSNEELNSTDSDGDDQRQQIASKREQTSSFHDSATRKKHRREPFPPPLTSFRTTSSLSQIARASRPVFTESLRARGSSADCLHQRLISPNDSITGYSPKVTPPTLTEITFRPHSAHCYSFMATIRDGYDGQGISLGQVAQLIASIGHTGKIDDFTMKSMEHNSIRRHISRLVEQSYPLPREQVVVTSMLCVPGSTKAEPLMPGALHCE